MEPGEKICEPGFVTVQLFRAFEGRRLKRDFDEKPDRFGFFSLLLLSRDDPTFFFFLN